jgi:hypothetical protein
VKRTIALDYTWLRDELDENSPQIEQTASISAAIVSDIGHRTLICTLLQQTSKQDVDSHSSGETFYSSLN